MDPATGRVIPRRVDVNSESYKIAQEWNFDEFYIECSVCIIDWIYNL